MLALERLMQTFTKDGRYKLLTWSGVHTDLSTGAYYDVIFEGQSWKFRDRAGDRRSCSYGTWEYTEPAKFKGRGEILELTGVKEDSWLDVTEGNAYMVIFSVWHKDFIFKDNLNNIQLACDYNWKPLCLTK